MAGTEIDTGNSAEDWLQAGVALSGGLLMFMMVKALSRQEQESVSVNEMCEWWEGEVAYKASPLQWSGKSAMSHVTSSMPPCAVQ